MSDYDNEMQQLCSILKMNIDKNNPKWEVILGSDDHYNSEFILEKIFSNKYWAVSKEILKGGYPIAQFYYNKRFSAAVKDGNIEEVKLFLSLLGEKPNSEKYSGIVLDGLRELADNENGRQIADTIINYVEAKWPNCPILYHASKKITEAYTDYIERHPNVNYQNRPKAIANEFHNAESEGRYEIIDVLLKYIEHHPDPEAIKNGLLAAAHMDKVDRVKFYLDYIDKHPHPEQYQEAIKEAFLDAENGEPMKFSH